MIVRVLGLRAVGAFRYELKLTLPKAVLDEEAKAKFDKKRKVLRLTLPINVSVSSAARDSRLTRSLPEA